MRACNTWRSGALLVVLAQLACTDRADLADTEVRDGLRYMATSEEPFTGIVEIRFEGTEQIEREARLKNGLLEGISLSYHPNGDRKAETYFLGGERHGPDREWTADGVLILEQEWISGERQGVVREWYPTGEPRAEGTYVNGSLEGQYVAWYQSGTKRLEREYRDGYRTGTNREWYESGQLRKEGTWEAGQPQGVHTEWHENGQRRAEVRYRAGTMVELSMWHEDGTPAPAQLPGGVTREITR